MTYKIGQTLHWCYADSDDGVVETGIAIVTSFQKGYVHAVNKNKYTWVKRSTRHHDWGWSNSISRYDRHKAIIGRPLYGLYVTKGQALREERAKVMSWEADDSEHKDKILRTLQSMITKENRKKK